MKLVIDANVVISALLKDNLIREIITSAEFNFVTPEFILEEIHKYKDYIKEKANLDDTNFESITTLLFEFIHVISKEEYSKEINRAEKLIEDIKDIPYVACYFALNCDGIWTNDNDFKRTGIKLFSTQELINVSRGC